MDVRKIAKTVLGYIESVEPGPTDIKLVRAGAKAALALNPDCSYCQQAMRGSPCCPVCASKRLAALGDTDE